jgi:hypothetical protein
MQMTISWRCVAKTGRGQVSISTPTALGPTVCFGSKPEVELADADFRSTRQSRHPAVANSWLIRNPTLLLEAASLPPGERQ